MSIWEIEKAMPTLWKLRHPDFYDKPNVARALLWGVLICSAAGGGLAFAQILSILR